MEQQKNHAISSSNQNSISTFKYSKDSYVFISGVQIDSLYPEVVGIVSKCSVMPSLPNGLILNSQTCVISGTPLNSQTTINYKVTASNTTSEISASLSIAINSIAVNASFKYIFVTSNTYNGNLGGLAGADTKCNADSAKPNISTYKAMLGTSTGRKPCTTVSQCAGLNGSQAIAWILQSGVQYRRADGTTVIGTANADLIIPFPLTNSISTSSEAWTGIDDDWRQTGSTPNCSNWGAATGNGAKSDLTKKNSDAINSGNSGCPTNRKLICVEQ
jgi:hypothetical protein